MIKNYTCSFIGQVGLAFGLIALSGAGVSARQLIPEEALSMLQSGTLKSPSTNPLKLAYIQETLTAEPAVYVFNREAGAGFYLLAADEAVGNIVLGYSDNGYFSADNMAPGLQWLLGAYSMCVSECARGGMLAPAKSSEVWGKVEPLISTKWNQDAPYNDMCPVLLGSRSVTGCVATAAAQIMKKHEWPVRGKGAYEYTYLLNGSPVQIQSDFSSHTYDWANMVDDYAGVSTTPEQKSAVAQLMFDCGVAAGMIFTPNESSASMVNEAVGMLEYFDYDKSMRFARREWFSDYEWRMMMYDQIVQGKPVFYSGEGFDSSGKRVGHAFVLDGYDGEGYFHFNWGWGGYGDLYCSLDHLVPGVDGIGGGAGDYSLNQEAILSIRPNTGDGSPLAVEFCINGDLQAQIVPYPEYNLNAVYFSTDEKIGFLNCSLAPVEIEIGFRTSNNDEVVSYGKTLFRPETGYDQIPLWVRQFPKGEYDVTPVYRTNGGQWTDMRHSIATSGRLHFISDGNTIQIQKVEVSDGIVGVETEAIIVRAFGGYIRVDAPGGTKVTVFDVAGTLFYQGADHEIPVERNRIYIVVAAGKVFKVRA